MDNNGKSNSQMQSSLLFKLPNSMLSFSDMNTNTVLMPVAVDPKEEVQCYSQKKEIHEKSNLQSKSSSSKPKSICQLEQPLLVKKGSTKPLVQFPSQVPLESQTSYSEPPVKEFVEDPISTSIENNSVNIVHQQCPGFEELFSEGPPKERKFSLPSTDETPNFRSLPAPTSAPVFCPVSSTSQVSSPPDFTPRPSVDSYRFLPNLNQEASMSNSEDPKLQQMTPDVFCHSSHHHTVLNSDYHAESCNYDYAPVTPYWLFEDIVESKEIWYGFSEKDSQCLERAYQTGISLVSTDGGRYDVDLQRRIKTSVYFDAKEMHVRRGSWFYETGSSMRYRPYPEDVAETLEQHYLNCFNSGQWQRRFNVPGIGSFVFESEQVMLHYKNELEVWPSLVDSKDSPKAVKRGLPDGFEIMPQEDFDIDHLVFIVQGIGSFCDLRFRTVSQCVDGFRDIANKLVSTHFKSEKEQKQVGRVEFLPVAWHAKLHTSEMGLDRRMQNITLPSIPKLRHFTNDTLIDILLYSNQSYCQSIIDTVSSELNTLYELFLSRNPSFTGKVFVAGHSLGSLILFDILANQVSSDSFKSSKSSVSFNSEQKNICNNFGLGQISSASAMNSENVESLLEYLDLKDSIELLKKERIDFKTLVALTDEDLEKLSIPLGTRNKLQNLIASEQSPVKSFLTELISSGLEGVKDNVSEQLSDDPKPRAYPSKNFISSMSLIVYPRLQFQPAGFFALGSPISMFLAARGYDSICEDFQFPTCPAFFHIFHPYDPVAFRIEPLIDPNFTAKPVLIPHHKGRKRMHLEIRENVTKIATEIKQKLMDTMRYTWNSLSEFAKNHSFPSAMIEAEVDKLVNQEMSEPVETLEASIEDLEIGLLNGGRRIDYVLQEKPIEALNDYVFALTSHATYWDSEDTVLMILREIYAMQGIVISTTQVDDKSVQSKIPSEENPPLEFIGTLNQTDKSLGIFQSFMSDDSLKSRESSPHIISTSTNDVACTGANSGVASTIPSSQSSSAIPGSQHIGPPPLSGFVKRSPFMR